MVKRKKIAKTIKNFLIVCHHILFYKQKMSYCLGTTDSFCGNLTVSEKFPSELYVILYR